jgi:hypothetical protein
MSDLRITTLLREMTPTTELAKSYTININLRNSNRGLSRDLIHPNPIPLTKIVSKSIII